MTSIVITPTVGRQVWYKPDPVNHPEVTYAATVVFVHSDTMVNLAVLDQNGNLFPRPSTRLVQPGEDAPAWPYCHWMPYQVGQAEVAAAPAEQPAEVPFGEAKLAVLLDAPASDKAEA